MGNECNNFGGTETLLVVDDDKLILNLLSDFLSENGYNVIKARDGEEAVEAYKKNCNEISLVLMDIVMPRKDGLTASTEIMEHNPEAIIYFMSGYSPDTIGSVAGGYFFKKPFSPSDIIKKIRYRLDGCSGDYED